jgi:DNA polymerase III subunit delta
MAALTLDALLRNLKKGAPDPVYLLHGDEDALKDEAVRALLDAAVDPPARDFNIDTRFAADLDAEALHALVNTPPMLATRRAVVLRGVDWLGKRKSKVRDELIRYLGAPNPTTVLVLVAGAEADPELGRGATVVTLDPLAPERVPRWISHHAAQLRLALAPDAVELLVAAVGNDLSALARELEKLAALAGDRTVTAADVTALVGVRRGETVHDLVEAALERQVARAAQLVEPVLEQAGMSGVKILTLIGTHLVGTALARAERDRGTSGARLEDTVFRQMLAARPYGLRGYKEEAARWVRWSERWTAAELSAALRAALAADRALKGTTVTDDGGIVTQLLLGFAVTRREAA